MWRLGVYKFFLLPIVMFGFSFLLVPLYDVFCDVIGINGKGASEKVERMPSVVEVDPTREVAVQFMQVSNSIEGMTVEPADRMLLISPGEIKKTRYIFKNNTDAPLRFVAVPSISPGEASLHLKKIDCFCFDVQEIAAGEKISMPVVFYLDSKMPKNFEKLTLNYTLYGSYDSVSLSE